MRRSEHAGALREELEHRIRAGRCVYCRAPAAPDHPLTREHVIPRARGGRRRDSRIIVPACARCNHRRGSQEVVLFLLARPRRISAFLDYLATLPPGTVREIDLRVFAELYAAVWLLHDSAAPDGSWRDRLRHLCAGRRLHRRRYAARRIVAAVALRLERIRDRAEEPVDGPACPLPVAPAGPEAVEGVLPRALPSLLGTLSVRWGVPPARVAEELDRERQRMGRAEAEARKPGGPSVGLAEDGSEEEQDARVVSLDGWKRRNPGRRRRPRIDRRRGRGGRYGRGRAA